MVQLADEPASMKTVFLSRLVPDGVILAHNQDGHSELFYVVSSTEFGVCALRCGVTVHDGHRVMTLLRTKQGEFITIPIRLDNMDEFGCQEVLPISPAYICLKLPGASLPFGIHFLLVQGSGNRVLPFAAKVGFRTMTVPQLKMLYKALEVPHKGAAPSTEHTSTFAMVRHCFPTWTDDEVLAAVSMRSAKVASQVPAIITEADVPTLAASYDDEEEKVEQQIEEILKGRLKGATKSGGGKKQAAGSRKVPAQPVKKTLDVQGELTKEAAASYIPQVKGCSIYKDTKLHMRWVCSYPTPSPPHSTSQAFGVSSDKAAMLHCIKWLWAQHVANGGEECPYLLD